MSQQYNKVIKRRRRLAYVKRKKERVKQKKVAPAAVPKPAATAQPVAAPEPKPAQA